MFLKIQQLLAAKYSPVSPIKKKYVPHAAEIVRQGDDAPFNRADGKLREYISRIENRAVAA
jgi:hypothetical protein